MPEKPEKGTQLKSKQKTEPQKTEPNTRACPNLCALVPTNVPRPEATQSILHPRKDVFVLKVSKVGAKGDRRCKMELELVTPKFPDKTPPYRLDTRETQCEPEPPPCCCMRTRKNRK